MSIERDEYIALLMQKRWNGKVKIITGIRRCGKSYLLNTLFKQKLIEEGIGADCFVELALDRKSQVKFRNPNKLYDYVVKKTKNQRSTTQMQRLASTAKVPQSRYQNFTMLLRSRNDRWVFSRKSLESKYLQGRMLATTMSAEISKAACAMAMAISTTTVAIPSTNFDS